jgi:glucokinase
MENVLAFDLGGTKLITGIVNQDGQIIEHQKKLIHSGRGPDQLIELMASEAKIFLKKHPEVKKAAIASAGPLDPAKGILLDPTNLKTDGQSWGQVQLTAKLGEKLGMSVTLENDAAAAVLACHWLGPGKNCKNLMTLTLGTGLGVGSICNGKLERSGRGLHPEAGHIIIGAGDKTALCGCGNFGCAEAYLSGMNFCKRFSKQHGIERIKGEELLKRAREKDPLVLKAFEEYSHLMAQTIASYVVLYAPENIVFAGGFSASYEFFASQVNEHLFKILARRREGEDLVPKLILADNYEHMVLLGAAAVALKEPLGK